MEIGDERADKVLPAQEEDGGVGLLDLVTWTMLAGRLWSVWGGVGLRQ